MVTNEIKKTIQNTTLKNVFIPFTLTFFLLLSFRLWEIVGVLSSNLNRFYFYALPLSGLFILISNYFLSYYGLLNGQMSKRGYRFTLSFFSFLSVLFLCFQGIYEVASNKSLNVGALYFLISLIIFWLLNQVLHSNYFSKLLNWTVGLFAAFYLFLQKFFISGETEIYRDLRDFTSDERFLNIFSLILVILSGVLATKYANIFFDKSLEEK